MTTASISELAPFGATDESVVEIGPSLDYRHVDYLDLQGLPSQLPRVTAVVEMAGRPVMYVVRGAQTKEILDATCHILAQRGSADHLGMLEPGVLTVVPLLGGRKRVGARWLAEDSSSRGRLPSLAFGIHRDAAPGTAHRLHEKLVKLLNKVTEAVVRAGVTEPEEALSLVGRALFLRFLIDRRIVSDADTKRVCPAANRLVEAMETPARFDATSRWLNETFNGNLLPLNHSSAFWSRVKKADRVCSELSKVLLKTDAYGQLAFDWDTLDFSHIPVGLLSQVYEKWCHTFTREKAIRDSVWYTPRSIAEYVVDEAFYGLQNPHLARVLDPAVGAGVFLVAAYRELVAAHWRSTGVRPTRKVLRQILYRQLVGFDVNEASLRLTALALYLTALELDPDPTTNHPLRFEDLRENGVLHDVRGPIDTDPNLPQVGSLGPHLSDKHKHAYDVVIGNPPWTAWASQHSDDPEVLRRRQLVETGLTPLVVESSGSPEPFDMLDFTPDLAFCWRALEWARPHGTIAFALHARMLFRLSDGGIWARNRLLQSVRVTGILNGAALAPTNVWPSHTAPFCLWFATNERPAPTDSFLFVSPVLDDQLNPHGYVRVDAASARRISQRQVSDQPWLLKCLYRGSSLDANILERLKHYPTLGSWLDELGIQPSRGYVDGAAKSKKYKAAHLHDLPELTAFDETRPIVNTTNLPRFKPRKVNRPRGAATFRGPLVLIFEAPRHDREVARAIMSRQSVAYNHVFFGISTASQPDSQALADYLLLLLNSSIYLYIALLRSSQFGADRNRLDLRDLLAIPCRPFDQLTRSQRDKVSVLAKKVIGSDVLPEREIDTFIGELLELTPWDLAVMRDTLETALPFSSAGGRAQARPTIDEARLFAATLGQLLSDMLLPFKRRIEVSLLPLSNTAPWLMLTIGPRTRSNGRNEMQLDPQELAMIMQVALDGGASRIVLPRKHQLLVGIFAQYRYWTETQARLLALELLGSADHEAWLRGDG